MKALMGINGCAPCRRRKNSLISSASAGVVGAGSDVLGLPSTAVVIIHVDGRIEESKMAIMARSVTSRYPSCFLCDSESMLIGSPPSPVAGDDFLLPGQLYFLIPLSRAHAPLSLADLCDLAVKARPVLADQSGET